MDSKNKINKVKTESEKSKTNNESNILEILNNIFGL